MGCGQSTLSVPISALLDKQGASWSFTNLTPLEAFCNWQIRFTGFEAYTNLYEEENEFLNERLIRITLDSKESFLDLVSAQNKLYDLGGVREDFMITYELMSPKQASQLDLHVIASLPLTLSNPKLNVDITITVIATDEMT